MFCTFMLIKRQTALNGRTHNTLYNMLYKLATCCRIIVSVACVGGYTNNGRDTIKL